ncbi:MAG: OstA-like protein [Candidatus Cyclobacteriaceae bacterium M2_1C_046]
MLKYFKYLLFIVFSLMAITSLGQKKIKLVQAEGLQGGQRNGESFMKYFGDVIFKQQETTIYCDSAFYFRKKNLVEAFGKVRIIDGDSINITARKLVYSGDKGEALLRQNVVFRKKAGMTLYTDFLDYDIDRELAKYFNGGRLVDSANVLTSERGTFDDRTGMATFNENVVAKFPDFTLRSSALKYDTRSEIVYFIAPTTLTNNDGSVVTYTEGQYDTRMKTSRLQQGEIETDDYTAKGIKVFSNEREETYRLVGDVVLTGKKDDIIITGAEAILNQKIGISKIFGNPVMKKPFENGDTLFLTADTLYSIDSEIEAEQRLLAFNNVRIYKSDMQGMADSLAYNPSDSLIRFFKNPILWSDENQMTADTITIYLEKGTIDRMQMDFNSFVISKDTIANFNQIKGRKMTSFFIEGKLRNVDVDGNCESIFFALDEKEQYLVGMNKIICSNMRIGFKNNVASRVKALTKPDASFTPPHELKPEEKTLRGFNWQIEKKPTKKDILQQVTSSTENSEEKKTGSL